MIEDFNEILELTRNLLIGDIAREVYRVGVAIMGVTSGLPGDEVLDVLTEHIDNAIWAAIMGYEDDEDD